MAQTTQHELNFDDNHQANILYGDLNRNLRTIEDTCSVKIKVRGTQAQITGDAHDVDLVSNLLEQLYLLINKGYPIYSSDVAFGIRILGSTPKANLARIFLDKVYVTTGNRIISPKTANQKFYIDEIRNKDIVFGIGPAGTGKTYLAVAMAVSALTNGLVRTIILTRPAVEAGEKLGFLPGDIKEKIDPYLRPIYDSLDENLPKDNVAKLIENQKIEIAPIAYLRGRTLNNSYIILDEAQNTSPIQMKMFLTRFGEHSKMVITGDITQIDLPSKKKSGLKDAINNLKNINDISFVYLTEKDVVRHFLVQKIVKAYDK